MHHPVTEWRLHIGCHKTATTHLQDTLALLQGELRQHGLAYISRATFRKAKVLKKLERVDWLLALGERPLRRRWERLVAPLRGEASHVLISEENFLGGANGLLCWPFYPEAERGLRWVHAFRGDAKLHIFLSIRSFDELLASAYAEMLRYRVLHGGFAPIKTWALANPPSWLELICRIKTALPETTLSVWTFEDYRRNPAAVISSLCGMPISLASTLPIPKKTKAPSAAAIAAIERLDPSAKKRRHVASVARILEADDDSEKFRPFSPAECEHLRAAYAGDLSEMRRRFPDMLIDVQ